MIIVVQPSSFGIALQPYQTFQLKFPEVTYKVLNVKKHVPTWPVCHEPYLLSSINTSRCAVLGQHNVTGGQEIYV